jgi:tetratricopeptide (TPR) repeat protein
MNPLRLACLFFGMLMSAAAADPPAAGVVQSTPKLEVLNRQIQSNAENAQAYSNRGYVLALLGRKEEARADLKKALSLKDDAPMHNGAGGWFS